MTNVFNGLTDEGAAMTNVFDGLTDEQEFIVQALRRLMQPVLNENGEDPKLLPFLYHGAPENVCTQSKALPSSGRISQLANGLCAP